jgi:hypothetical protein
VNVSSNRSFAIAGYIQTSHGRVKTTVSQTVNFSSHQLFNITGSEYVQDISQATSVASETRTSGGGPQTLTSQQFNFPLTLNISEVFLSSGGLNITTTADQNYSAAEVATQSNKVTYASSQVNKAQHVDTLELDSSFNIIGNTGQSGAQQYSSSDSTGAKYGCDLTAAANVLTAFSSGCTN